MSGEMTQGDTQISPERLARLRDVFCNNGGDLREFRWQVVKIIDELQALRARDGYVLVPEWPTKEMVDAWWEAYKAGGAFQTMYRAMLAAAEKGKVP